MIPKIIHYCWFGGNPKPKDVLKYIESWKKYLPDYKIIEWNEGNYDVYKCQYMADAYKEKNGHLSLIIADSMLYINMEESIWIQTWRL
mgnify:CR=1 FL=1